MGDTWRDDLLNDLLVFRLRGQPGGGWIVAFETVSIIAATLTGLIVLISGIKGLKAARGFDSITGCRSLSLAGSVGAVIWLVLRIIVAIIYGAGIDAGTAFDIGSPIAMLLTSAFGYLSTNRADM